MYNDVLIVFTHDMHFFLYSLRSYISVVDNRQSDDLVYIKSNKNLIYEIDIEKP